MKSRHLLALASTLVISTLFTAPAQAEFGDGLSAMLSESTTKLMFRYRYETVDQDGFSEDAGASTLKSRITWTSGTSGGFTLVGEVDNVTVLGSERYNSTVNGMGTYPVVADPTGTDLNQALIKYGFEGGSTISVGRQRILHAEQRFVGGVAWRQNEQTYDGIRLNIQATENVTVDYSYISRVHRIFGPDEGVQPSMWDSNSHIVYSKFTLTEGHSIGAFGYLLDFENGNGINNSTSTFGLDYRGAAGPIGLKFSAATQKDFGESTLDYSTTYLFAEVSGNVGPVKLAAGYEELGSDNGVGFKTPLATLHKFQGFADKFLVTPGTGIEDAYISASGKIGNLALAATYHAFDPETGGSDIGDELDIVATYPFNKHFTAQAKYASFDADSSSGDTDKFWLMFTATF